MPNARQEPRELFELMLERVTEIKNEFGLKDYEAFARWFADLYFENPHEHNIPDGSRDGKVDLFFKENGAGAIDHILVNSKFTRTYGKTAPPNFYDEITGFCSAFKNKQARDGYIKGVRPELRVPYRKLFRHFDNGEAHLFFVTNRKRNDNKFDSVKDLGVEIFHWEELELFIAEDLEGAMPRTKDIVLSSITNILSDEETDRRVKTHFVFARLIDFVHYMKGDPQGLLFARNVRYVLTNSKVNECKYSG